MRTKAFKQKGFPSAGLRVHRLRWLSPLYLAGMFACRPAPDFVVSGGTIYTSLEDQVSAIAIRDGIVVATGQEAEQLVNRAVENYDLEGATVVPGLHDAHTHLLPGNFALDRLLLLGKSSMAELTSAVEDYVASMPEDEPWVVGYGWLKEQIPDPDGRPLDAIVSERPLILVSNSGHEAIVNRVALENAGITSETPDPVGGTIVRDPQTGEPTGYLIEAAVQLVAPQVIEAYEDTRLSSTLGERIVSFSQAGLTAISEILAVPGIDLARPWIYEQMEEAGTLPLRVFWFVPVFSLSDFERVPKMRAASQGNLVRFGGAKIWIDGSMSGAGAWVEEPYTTVAGQGVHYFEPLEIEELILKAKEWEIPLKIHANGDAAIAAVLDAVEAAASLPGAMPPITLEHAVITDPDDLLRMADLGIYASIQPSHVLFSAIGLTAEALGADRFAKTYDFQGMVQSGVPLAMGTDWPAFPVIHPLHVIRTASDLQTTNGGIVSDHSIAIRDSWKSYTEGSAGSAGQSDVGRLEVGFVADFLILNEDPLVSSPAEIGIREVWVDGKRVQ